jgi:hypothetical protein
MREIVSSFPHTLYDITPHQEQKVGALKATKASPEVHKVHKCSEAPRYKARTITQCSEALRPKPHEDKLHCPS